jgi:hypothetical protein
LVSGALTFFDALEDTNLGDGIVKSHVFGESPNRLKDGVFLAHGWKMPELRRENKRKSGPLRNFSQKKGAGVKAERWGQQNRVESRRGI